MSLKIEPRREPSPGGCSTPRRCWRWLLTVRDRRSSCSSFLGNDPLERADELLHLAAARPATALAELGVKATPLMLIASASPSASAPTSGTSAPRASSPSARIAGGGVALATWRPGRRAGSCRRCWSPASSAAWPGPRSRPSCTRFNANEILTSLMLVYVATLFLSYLVYGPWKDPEGYNFPQSRMFDDAADRCRSSSRARGCTSAR